MSAPPSRSDLEKALRAKRTSKPSDRQRGAERAADLNAPRRHQSRVLGGDLSGVNSKSLRRHIWAKVNAFGVINAVASLIVAFILLAFFWPQDHKGVKEIALQEQQVQVESFYSESRADVIPNLNEGVDASFTRKTDIPRAEDFREQDYVETRSKELLALAESQLSANHFTIPKGANAAETYREVLALNPKNVDAQRGLDYISGRFLSTGASAAQQGNLVAARASLKSLAELDAGSGAEFESEEHSQLSGLIKAAEQVVQIKRLMKRADAAFASENYILPAQNNAWSLYKQVLEIEPENKQALAGVELIANTYIDLANTAAMAGEYQAAAGYLATVGVIDPENPSIEILEEIVSRAQPLADKAAASQQQAQVRVVNDPLQADDQNTNLTVAVEPKTDSTEPKVDSSSSPSVNTPSNISTPSTNTAIDVTSVSQSRTPQVEASEQAAFDRQYLDRGLDAYYQGDYETATALLTPLADKGISRAQFRIAYMHFLGRGFSKNRSEADRIIRAALPAIQAFASEGRAWAQSDLGSLYEDGLVLPRDYKEAFFWYRASAEQGYAGAQTNLGILYAEGRGIAASRSTAIEWFKKASAQGDAAATRNLESLSNP